ncbi:MAG: VOC family protein [Hyphomonadaceae bacterium]|nr:VOC family protein [Hyphomonadaceae bacterium]
MILGLDHVVVATFELEAAVASYAALLGCDAGAPIVDDGVATIVLPGGNVAVELKAPVGGGEGADRLRAALGDGEGLKSLVFAVSDIETAHRRAGRVGLDPGPIADRGDLQSFRLADAKTSGLRLFLVERATGAAAQQRKPGAVTGLDHVVIQSGDLERAAALFGARLGLDMRLDREVMGRRLLFFRCGDSVVEVAQTPVAEARDRLWGLSWRVENIDAARQRLESAGFDVSEARAGAKPGTRVVSIRNRTGNVPTILIERVSRV